MLFTNSERNNVESKQCFPFKKSKVNDFIEEFEKEAEEDDVSLDISVDCSSNYISKAFIFLLSLIF